MWQKPNCDKTKNVTKLTMWQLKAGFGSVLVNAPQVPLSPPPPQNCTKNWASWDSRFLYSFEGRGALPSKLCKTSNKGGPWLVMVKLLKLCRTSGALSCWPLGLTIEKRPYRAEGPVNLGGVLSCRTEAVRSTPGVRGGASPAYSAVPKSQELGSQFERRGCVAPTEWGVELPLPILRYPSHES